MPPLNKNCAVSARGTPKPNVPAQDLILDILELFSEWKLFFLWGNILALTHASLCYTREGCVVIRGPEETEFIEQLGVLIIKDPISNNHQAASGR